VSCSVQFLPDELEVLAVDDKTTSDDVLGRCNMIGGLAEEPQDGPVLPELHILPKEIIWMKHLGAGNRSMVRTGVERHLKVYPMPTLPE
jgi:hypothetical protein